MTTQQEQQRRQRLYFNYVQRREGRDVDDVVVQVGSRRHNDDNDDFSFSVSTDAKPTNLFKETQQQREVPTTEHYSKTSYIDKGQGSSVPSFSNKQIKQDFTTTTHCDVNEISFLIYRFRKNPEGAAMYSKQSTASQHTQTRA